jgi:acyl-CoA reductase-like NAD-dependent aldehyde dehydrogenase
MDVLAVVTSAAVGALASSAINMAGQWRERTARRRELLFRAAVDIAEKRQELLIKEAIRTNQHLLLPDNIFNVAEYFAHLEHLFKTGTLPTELHEKHEASKQWHEAMSKTPKG